MENSTQQKSAAPLVFGLLGLILSVTLGWLLWWTYFYPIMTLVFSFLGVLLGVTKKNTGGLVTGIIGLVFSLIQVFILVLAVSAASTV